VTQKRDAAIVGIHEYPSRDVEGRVSPLQIKAASAARALADAGLTWRDVDAVKDVSFAVEEGGFGFRADVPPPEEIVALERPTAALMMEAVRLVVERRVTMAQAARDLDVHVNVLRKWVRAYRQDPGQAFPGVGQQAPEAAEVTQLRREVARLKMERDILKKAAAYFAKESL
jgi:transposase